MKLNWIRLVFGGLWLVLGSALLLRDRVGLNLLSDRYASDNLNLGGGLAIAFAVWNAVRWLSARPWAKVAPARGVRRPLAEKTNGDRPFEYNPELDFLKPEAETKMPESQ